MILVDMRPIHQLSSITDNPFDTETLTENPVVTELNVIGQGWSWSVIRGTHTQSIIDGRAVSDELNKILTESDLDDLNSCIIDMENMDRNPAAREDPIKDTPSLKEPITKSYLGKRLCQL